MLGCIETPPTRFIRQPLSFSVLQSVRMWAKCTQHVIHVSCSPNQQILCSCLKPSESGLYYPSLWASGLLSSDHSHPAQFCSLGSRVSLACISKLFQTSQKPVPKVYLRAQTTWPSTVTATNHAVPVFCINRFSCGWDSSWHPLVKVGKASFSPELQEI